MIKITKETIKSANTNTWPPMYVIGAICSHVWPGNGDTSTDMPITIMDIT